MPETHPWQNVEQKVPPRVFSLRYAPVNPSAPVLPGAAERLGPNPGPRPSLMGNGPYFPVPGPSASTYEDMKA